MKKAGYFFLCFLPLFASIGLQFIAAFPVMGITVIRLSFSGMSASSGAQSGELFPRLYTAFTDQSFLMTVSVLYAVLGILFFGFWYCRQFQGSLHFPLEKFTNPGLILGVILLIPALQVVSSFLAAAFAAISPDAMEFYESLMDSAGFSQTPSALLILYAVLLGPVAEELTFRGVTLSSAKKALPFWAANLFQALLFGVFHMNLIQGVYAFFIGICLGYICERSGSIWISVFLHILYNAWGTFVNLYSPMLLIIFILLGILGIWLFCKNTSSPAIKNMTHTSDI